MSNINLLFLFAILSAWLLNISTLTPSIDGNFYQERKVIGKSKLEEIQDMSESSSCWKEAVTKLNSTCKKLTDLQQSFLALAFANCHLEKSGRETYYCNETVPFKDCTRDMNPVAFQTYTEFFTHTGHICYFLQNELWQEHTQNVILKLSSTSTEAVQKLEQSLRYHKELDHKQNRVLDNQIAILDQDRRIAASLDDTRQNMDKAFSDLNQMTEKHKLILTEMFGNLQGSIDGIRYLMSLFLIELIGFETLALFFVSGLVIIFLPQFRYSRFKLYLFLFGEVVLEVFVRRMYGYFVLWSGAGSRAKAPPESLETLHACIWWCRYLYFVLSLIAYIWEWFSYEDHTLLLNDLQKRTDLIINHLGIVPPSNKLNQATASVHVESGPHLPVDPSPARHSLPAVSRDVEVPHGAQPTDLTRRGGFDLTPNIEGDHIDGGVISKRRVDRYSSPLQQRLSNLQYNDSPYNFDPIPGLDPPVGHPLSPFTDRQITDYIASLPAQFDTSDGQSFKSTHTAPPDSDSDRSTCDRNSNNTLLVSESSFVCQPIDHKQSVSPKRPVQNTNINSRLSGPGRPDFRQRRLVPNNDSLPIKKGPEDKWRQEKEVREEKQLSRGNNSQSGTPRATVGSGARSRKTEPVTPSSAYLLLASPSERRNSVQPQGPITSTPHRYNLRSRSLLKTPTPTSHYN